MGKLLKLEFRKLRKQKSFYICTALMLALLLFSAVTMKQAYIGAGAAFAENALSACSFLMFAGIVTALLVCDDYEQQTIKNIYARGYSRSQVYFSKFISVFLAVTAMFALVELGAILLGCFYFGVEDGTGFRWLGTIAAQYAACMANVSFYFVVSATLRKNGAAIAGVLVAPTLVSMALGLADSLLKSETVVLANWWVAALPAAFSGQTAEAGRFAGCFLASLLYIPFFVLGGRFFQKKLEGVF